MNQVDNKFKERAGYIYIIKNEFHKENLFKVGRTHKSVFERIRDEYEKKGTFTPMELSPIAEFAVNDPVKAEKKIHQILSPFKSQGEWFNIKYEELDKIIKENIREFQSFSIIDNQVVAKDKIEKDLKYTVINIDTFGKIENGDFERAYVSVCKSNKFALGDDKEEIVKKKIDNNLNNLKTTLENISKEFNVEKTFIDICTNFIFNEKVFEIVSIALSVGFISPVVICSFDKEKDSNFLNKINKQFNYSKDGEE